MIKLDTIQVLYLHDIMCRATGGLHELRDVGALESAIYHAYASFERGLNEKDRHKSKTFSRWGIGKKISRKYPLGKR